MTHTVLREKLAKLLVEFRHDEHNGWDDLGSDEKSEFLTEADAILNFVREELQEPSETMRLGVWQESDIGFYVGSVAEDSDEKLDEYWRAMLNNSGLNAAPTANIPTS